MSYLEDLVELSLAGVNTTGMSIIEVKDAASRARWATEPDDHVRLLKSKGADALWNNCFKEYYENWHWPHAKACERADRMVKEAKQRAGL